LLASDAQASARTEWACGVAVVSRVHGLNPRNRIVAPRMWRTYRTLRSASCVDGLAVRAAVWRRLGGGGYACVRDGAAGGPPVALSRNRTNSRLNYIAIIAEPSRRVTLTVDAASRGDADGGAAGAVHPGHRTAGRRRPPVTRLVRGRRQTQRHSALATAPGRRVLRGGVARNCRNGAIGELRHQQCRLPAPARIAVTYDEFGIRIG
jgi:hypothetical protein